MALALTRHAVDQFIRRWRSDVPREDARVELTLLVSQATPTRRLTILGDARLYVTLTPAGELISLAVRDDTVVTVLPQDAESTRDEGVDPELLDESRETVAACRAMLAEDHQNSLASPQPAAPDDPRFLNAVRLLLEWRRGRHYRKRTVRRAYEAVGVPFTAFSPKCRCWECDRDRGPV